MTVRDLKAKLDLFPLDMRVVLEDFADVSIDVSHIDRDTFVAMVQSVELSDAYDCVATARNVRDFNRFLDRSL